MKFSPATLMILASIIMLLSTHTHASKEAEQSAREIAAFVNERPIYTDQLSAKHQIKIAKYKRFNRNQEPSKEIKKMMLGAVLEEYINTELVLQASQKHHVNNLKQKVSDKIREQEKHNTDSDKPINKTSIENQIRIDDYLQAHDLVNPQKPEKELKELYEKNKQQFASKKTRAHILHIITEEKQDIINAQKLLLEGKSFSEVSKEYSIDVNTAEDGDLGFIELGYMPKEVDKLILSLKIDELSPIIETDQGYHLIKVLNKKPAGTIPTFEQMKSFLAKGYAPKIRAQKIQQHLKQLKEQAQIKILLK